VSGSRIGENLASCPSLTIPLRHDPLLSIPPTRGPSVQSPRHGPSYQSPPDAVRAKKVSIVRSPSLNSDLAHLRPSPIALSAVARHSGSLPPPFFSLFLLPPLFRALLAPSFAGTFPVALTR